MTELFTTIETPSGSVRVAGIQAAEFEFSRAFGGDLPTGTIRIARDRWLDAGVSPDTDDVVTVSDGGGTAIETLLLRDVRIEGSDAILDVASFERLGMRTEPTAPVKRVDGTDKEIVTDIVSKVDRWSVNSVAETTGLLQMSFSLQQPHEQLLAVAEAANAEYRFDGGELTWADSLGTDRTDTTLGPGDANIADQFRVLNSGVATGLATHALVKGSGEGGGDARLALVVPETDTRDYSKFDPVHVETYRAPHWGAPADDNWTSYDQSSAFEENRIAGIAGHIVDELRGGDPETRVSTSLVGLGPPPALGDEFAVSHPERDLGATTLRVIERTLTIGADTEQQSQCILSNRTPVREANQDQRQTRRSEQFGRGVAGFVDRSGSGIGSGSWQLTDATEDVRADIQYVRPDDVAAEEVASLKVRGRAWRSPVELLSHSHQFSLNETTDVIAPDEQDLGGLSSFDGTFSPDTSTLPQTIESITFGDIDAWPVVVNWALSIAGADVDNGYQFRDFGVSFDFPQVGDVSSLAPLLGTIRFGPEDGMRQTHGSGRGIIFRDISNRTMEFTVTAVVIDGNGNEVTDATVIYAASIEDVTPHAHNISATETSDGTVPATPSVTTTFPNGSGGSAGPFYATGDIEIDGNTVATDVGTTSGAWSETIDISGEMGLSGGEKTIEFVPTSGRGEVELQLQAIEEFRTGAD